MGVVSEGVQSIVRGDILTLNSKGYLAVNPEYILDGAWYRRKTVVAASMVDDETITNMGRISSIHHTIHTMPSMECDTALRD